MASKKVLWQTKKFNDWIRLVVLGISYTKPQAPNQSIVFLEENLTHDTSAPTAVVLKNLPKGLCKTSNNLHPQYVLFAHMLQDPDVQILNWMLSAPKDGLSFPAYHDKSVFVVNIETMYIDHGRFLCEPNGGYYRCL
jgi:hypothetical protein